jgi:signal transduction histidine kinase
VATGIRSILAGHTKDFQQEYPCHSPLEKRWFVVRVTRFQTTGPARVVVAHENVTERKRAEAEVAEMHRQLLETSRQAGMAEVATGVLHNVGNVLNSVNVASTLLSDNLKKSKAPNLSKAVALMREHATNLGVFMTSDPKGTQLPGYLAQLGEHLVSEQTAALKELAGLQKNIEHIKDIVAMQQSYAKVSGVTETLMVTDLVEDALRMNASALERHEVQVVREYADLPPITVDKHKILQILVNLIRNAKYACDDSGRPDRQMKVRISNHNERIQISVIDNGVGIPQENLLRIFNHGFTTRKEGHGFGLHSGALAAKEMGGTLSVHSDGPGTGATFTIELPGWKN